MIAFNVSDSEIYFFHFLGLTDNWRNQADKLPGNFCSSLHVKEPLIAELAKKAMLRDLRDEISPEQIRARDTDLRP